MKIDKIKKVRGNKYKLHLSNDEKVTTYDDVIIKNNLLFNSELDSELLNKVETDTQYYKVYNKVINFISTRIRSKKEIENFLDKNDVVEEDKQNILNKLTEIGFINDHNFAKAYINDKIYLSNYGPDKIRKDLLEHSIDINIIDTLLAKVDIDDVKEKITKIIEKKVRSNRKYSNYQLKQKLIFELVNMGYNRDSIIECFDETDIDTNDILVNQLEIIHNKLSKKYSGKDLYFKIREKLYQKGFSGNEVDLLINEKVEI
jgi:regulatory protein